MGNLFLHERLFPTDLFFKNFFDTQSDYQSFAEVKPGYPCDIKVEEAGLQFDIACVGLDKDDIKLDIADNTLRVIYEKPTIESNPSDEDAGHYIHRGIVRKAFNLGWKISPKYNLDEIEAVMKNGLLTITIPIAEEAKPKTIKIK